MPTIKPFGSNILVEPETSKAILGDSLCQYGKVVAVDPEWVKSIKVGDTIGYLTWGLNHLEIDGKKYYFVPCNPEFILGIIELATEPVQTDVAA